MADLDDATIDWICIQIDRWVQIKRDATERPPPAWSPEAPTEPGWYWLWLRGGEKAEVVRVIDDHGRLTLDDEITCVEDMSPRAEWIRLHPPEPPR